MFKYSDEIQTVKVYDFSAITGEYIGQSDAMIAPNTGLPARCTDIKPPKMKSGITAIFSNGAWSLVDDLRGLTVYNTVNGMPFVISELGAFPENSTRLAPASRFDRWDGEAWVKDDEAERIQQIQDAELQKKELMNQAILQIDTLQDAVDLEMASANERKQLNAWKKYRVLLNRVDVNTAPDITWPEVVG